MNNLNSECTKIVSYCKGFGKLTPVSKTGLLVNVYEYESNG